VSHKKTNDIIHP